MSRGVDVNIVSTRKPCPHHQFGRPSHVHLVLQQSILSLSLSLALSGLCSAADPINLSDFHALLDTDNHKTHHAFSHAGR